MKVLSFVILVVSALLLTGTGAFNNEPHIDGEPEIMSADEIPAHLFDEHGYYYLKKGHPDTEMRTILSDRGPNGKRFWDDEEDEKSNPPDGEISSTVDANTETKEPTEADSIGTGGLARDCKVLESGILECNGVTTADATNAAKKFMAASADADTCPIDGDVCKAPARTSEKILEPEEEEEALECSPGWLRERNFCYDAAYKMHATYNSARQYCELVGSKLLYPISLLEAKKILQFMNEAWIGAVYNNSTDGGWQWLDGSPLPANVSLLGGLHAEPGRRCVCIRSNSLGDHVSFVKAKCSALKSFVCRATVMEQLQHQQRMAEEKAVPGQCPNGWTLISGYCHFTPKLAGDWSNGELWCNNHHNSKLVALLDREHERAVDQLVGRNSSYHIGMRFRRATSSWGWMNGSPATYRNWKHGRDPSHAGGDKDISCAFRHTNKDYWAPVACMTAKIFVCAFKLADQNNINVKDENMKSSFVDVGNLKGEFTK